MDLPNVNVSIFVYDVVRKRFCKMFPDNSCLGQFQYDRIRQIILLCNGLSSLCESIASGDKYKLASVSVRRNCLIRVSYS